MDIKGGSELKGFNLVSNHCKWLGGEPSIFQLIHNRENSTHHSAGNFLLHSENVFRPTDVENNKMIHTEGIRDFSSLHYYSYY